MLSILFAKSNKFAMFPIINYCATLLCNNKLLQLRNCIKNMWCEVSATKYSRFCRGVDVDSDGHDKPFCTKATTIIDNFKNVLSDTSMNLIF